MKELAEHALNTAQVGGASYADIRISDLAHESIEVKNGEVAAVSRSQSEGFGVRVVVDGAWGFASSARLERGEIDAVVEQALRIARASARVRGAPVNLGEPVRSRGTYRTPIRQDPFAVPLERKVDLLMKADTEMGSVPGVRVREGGLVFLRHHKLFASSEGALVTQELYESGGGISVMATNDEEAQDRAFPNSFQDHGTAGYEYIEAMQLVENARPTAEEAMALLTAPQCPPGLTTTVILDASQVALQVHESCGHPIELDRVLGTEAAFAGTSFMTTDQLGKLRYGSDQVTIVADATTPEGLGTFGYDDEGVPAQRTDVVKQGLFVGYLTSRETAPVIGRQSNGTMRADGWNRLPIIRMTNVSLLPGTSSLDEMIGTTDDGIYMRTNRSWSIDDKRLNFQFGTQLAYEIKNGKRGRLLKNATYAGRTPDFWNSCDAVGGAKEWRLWGLANCGKGQPMQVSHVGHGAAPARFRNVRVGVLKG
jgi:TldD protein